MAEGRRMSVQSDVRLELTELKKLGVTVSQKVFDWVDNNKIAIEEYRNNGMSVSDIADIARDLS